MNRSNGIGISSLESLELELIFGLELTSDHFQNIQGPKGIFTGYNNLDITHVPSDKTFQSHFFSFLSPLRYHGSSSSIKYHVRHYVGGGRRQTPVACNEKRKPHTSHYSSRPVATKPTNLLILAIITVDRQKQNNGKKQLNPRWSSSCKERKSIPPNSSLCVISSNASVSLTASRSHNNSSILKDTEIRTSGTWEGLSCEIDLILQTQINEMGYFQAKKLLSTENIG